MFILASADSSAAGIIAAVGLMTVLFLLMRLATAPDREAEELRAGRQVRLTAQGDQLNVFVITQDGQQEDLKMFPLTQAQAADAYQQELRQRVHLAPNN